MPISLNQWSIKCGHYCHGHPASIAAVYEKLACWIYGFCGFNYNNLQPGGSQRFNLLPSMAFRPHRLATRSTFASFNEGEEMDFGRFGSTSTQ
jgi:hypothetical protein